MKIITILLPLFIGIILGCQNSDLEVATTESFTSNEQITPLRGTFDFTYKGVTYSSPYYMENDTLMILENEQVANLYEQLLELPELATYVTPNGDIEYFDFYNDLLNEHPIKTTDISPYADFHIALTIYEHAHYNLEKSGRSHYFNFFVGMDFRDLRAFNMNDMISSVRVYGPQHASHANGMTFFRDKDFGGQSITFSTHSGIYDNEFPLEETYYFLKVENFRNYNIKKGMSWNDRISSFKVF
ncbi:MULTISPECIES: hypothetical protein [Butyricimonas]|uniref:hypothetical protein n=1 Tax=Butyricimonas TaxID=574697 RepID=UPI0007FB26C0|nr:MULTISPECIES: hypothetical protein [Butyricimonas]